MSEEVPQKLIQNSFKHYSNVNRKRRKRERRKRIKKRKGKN